MTQTLGYSVNAIDAIGNSSLAQVLMMAKHFLSSIKLDVLKHLDG